MSREIEQNPIKEQIPFDNSEREKIPSDKTPVIQTEKSSELSTSDNNPFDVPPINEITSAVVVIQTETEKSSELSTSDNNPFDVPPINEITPAVVVIQTETEKSSELSTSDNNPSGVPPINEITPAAIVIQTEKSSELSTSDNTRKITSRKRNKVYIPKRPGEKDRFNLVIHDELVAGPSDDPEGSKKMCPENLPATEISGEISGNFSPKKSSSDDHSSDDNSYTRNRKITKKRNKARFAPYEKTSGEKDLAIPEPFLSTADPSMEIEYSEPFSTADPSMETPITEYFSSGKTKPSSEERGKRKREKYDLNLNLHKEFNWRDAKKIKLDTLNDREAVLSQRQSFTTLLSSASLILPPEVDMVLVSRSGYVVEWKQEDSNSQIPPTKVTHALKEDRREIIGDEIHESSFQIPCSYHNNFTEKEFKERAMTEKRHIIQSKVEDTEHSFLQQTTITNNQLKEAAIKKKEITTKEKLTTVISQINESLRYFEYIPTTNVPIRDKQSVSIYFFYFFIFRTRIIF
jgi:hypothetical protein